MASDTQGAYVAPGWLLFVRQGTLLAQPFDLARRTLGGEPITVADSIAFEPITGAGAFSTSDAGVMAYRDGRPSVTRLSWFNRSGNSLATLGSPEQAGLSNLRLSPDGHRVAVERTLKNETDLWLLDSTRQLPFTRGSDGSIARLPVWSPDGGRIAFESVRSGSVALSVKPSTGDGDEEILFESPETKIPCDWSPDSKFLVYHVPDPKTGTDLWVLPLDTRVPFVFLKTAANELWGQFSPDGRWLAYQSNETGRYEIYVRPFPARGGAVPDLHGRWRLSAMVSRREGAVFHCPRREDDGRRDSSRRDDVRSRPPGGAVPDAEAGWRVERDRPQSSVRCRSGWTVPDQRRR